MQKINTSYIRSKIDKLIVFVLFFLVSSYSFADAICKDGWKSKSAGSGTCSHHGGVAKWLPDGANDSWGGIFIFIGIAIVIYIIIKNNSSKSNSSNSTSSKQTTKKPPNPISTDKTEDLYGTHKELIKDGPVKWFKYSKAISQAEVKFFKKFDSLSEAERYDALIVLLFEEFKKGGFSKDKFYNAINGMHDSSPIFLYIFRIKLDVASKDYQAGILSEIYAKYLLERENNDDPEDAMVKAYKKHFFGNRDF